MNYSTTTDTWNQNPERMLQLMKENGGFFDSDAAPTVSLWRFYFRHRDETTGEESWRMRVVVDTQGTNVSVIATKFLYDSGDAKIADKLSELMWCQFGDMNNVAPFMFHMVRSLGMLLAARRDAMVEDELVHALRRGDPAVLRTLHTEHAPAIARIARA